MVAILVFQGTISHHGCQRMNYKLTSIYPNSQLALTMHVLPHSDASLAILFLFFGGIVLILDVPESRQKQPYWTQPHNSWQGNSLPFLCFWYMMSSHLQSRRSS